MSQLLFPEWRISNRTMRYPFADSALLTSQNGFRIPDELFVDACLFPLGANAGVYLGAVLVAGSQVTLRLADPRQTNLAEAAFDALEAPEVLVFRDRYERPAGILVTDPAALPLLASWGDGTHAFFPEATPFAASAVAPQLEPGVEGLLVDDELVAGDVWLVGGDGVVLRCQEGRIRIDVVGDPLFRRRACGPETFATPRFLRTINGVAGGAGGEFKITTGSRLASDTILRIYAARDGLHFEAVGEKLEGIVNSPFR